MRVLGIFVGLWFVILQDIHTRTGQPNNFHPALKAASIAGSVISMVGLTITILTMLGFRFVHCRTWPLFYL